MSWRVHLTNQAIQNLHVLPAKSPVVVAWTRYDRFELFDLEMGATLGEKILSTPPTAFYESEQWQDYVSHLWGVGRVYLPYVRNAEREILLTDDGKLRVYFEGDSELTLDTDGIISPISEEDGFHFLAVDLDRQLGTVAAIDDGGQLHLYQQDILLGIFDIGLRPTPDLRVRVSISNGGQNIYATDGVRVVAVNSAGKVRKAFEAHYTIGRIACSPSGSMLVISDTENGVLRAYRGEDLLLTHQKFAIELLAHSAQVQLIADLPPIMTTISSLAVFTQGTIVFAMSGVVCMTDVSYMDELPRPQLLL
jgi:hypothetical protein